MSERDDKIREQEFFTVTMCLEGAKMMQISVAELCEIAELAKTADELAAALDACFEIRMSQK